MTSRYNLDSIARGLDHHQAAGVVLGWSWNTASARYVVRTEVLGEVDLTKAQAWAFCVALAAAERHNREKNEVAGGLPVDDWAALMDDDERSGAAVCPTCRLSAHHPGCPTPWAAMVTP